MALPPGANKLALLECDPGLGKSLIALDLCARLSRGLPFPDGAPSPGPANSLVLNAEDGPADTVRARLVSPGADLNRVFVPSAGHLGAIRLPGQIRRLEDAITAAAARLVVIDPLLAFLDSNVSSGSDQSVRRALEPLAELAARLECVILLIRHLIKKGAKRAVYSGAGAIGLLGLCRSAWLVGRDPGHPGQCVLAQVKNNLAPQQTSLAYQVASDEGGAVRLSWHGTSPWSADQVVAGPGRSSARVKARAFLMGLLKDGPRLVRDIWAEAQKQNFALRTLQRARDDLLIDRQCVTLDGRRNNWWLLPGQRLPAEAYPPVDPEADISPWLDRLEEKYGHLTPLDDDDA